MSVCSGALILAAAGILKGHAATTHWIAQDMLSGFGAEPQPNKRIVKSGKIVTAAGVPAGIDLGLFIVGELCGQERAKNPRNAISAPLAMWRSVLERVRAKAFGASRVG